VLQILFKIPCRIQLGVIVNSPFQGSFFGVRMRF
jgi:hypothetical protein